MNRDAVRAADNLVYYFKLCMERSGSRWDRDNETEIRQIIEDVMDAVHSTIEDAFDRHNENEKENNK